MDVSTLISSEVQRLQHRVCRRILRPSPSDRALNRSNVLNSSLYPYATLELVSLVLHRILSRHYRPVTRLTMAVHQLWPRRLYFMLTWAVNMIDRKSNIRLQNCKLCVQYSCNLSIVAAISTAGVG